MLSTSGFICVFLATYLPAAEPASSIPGRPPGILVRGGTMRLFNGRMPTSLAFSPDGRTLASGDENGDAHLWDRATGKQVPLSGHTGEIWSVAYLPDGKTLLTTGSDRTLRLWDPATARELHRIEGHEDVVWSVAVAPDGKTAVSGSSDGTVRHWDLATGKELRRFAEKQSDVFAVALSPDGALLATAESRDILAQEGTNAVHLWETATGKKLRTLPDFDGRVRSLAFAPDGKLLATASEDGKVRLWESASGKLVHDLRGHRDGARCVVFSRDGRTVLSGGADHAISRSDAANGKQIDCRYGHNRAVSSLALSSDGQTLASGSEDNFIACWPAAELSGHKDRILCAALSPDGRLLATACKDREVRVWDLVTGRETASFVTGKGVIEGLGFRPDGRTVVAFDSKYFVHVWDAKANKEVRTYQLKDALNQTLQVGVAADGRLSAPVFFGTTIVSQNPATGDALPTIQVQDFKVYSKPGHFFSVDGREVILFTESEDHAILVVRCDSATGKEKSRHTIRYARKKKERERGAPVEGGGLDEVDDGWHNFDIRLSPDGRYLMLTRFPKESIATLWDLKSGRKVLRWEGWFPETGQVKFSPDGRVLATTGPLDDLDIHLTELLSGQECARLSGLGSPATHILFTADGRRLVSVHEDLTFAVWDLGKHAQSDRPATELAAKDVERLWADLANADAGRAWRARWTLAAAGRSSVPFLREQIQFPADQQRLARLLVDLESSKFPVRRQAELDLESLGEAAEPALREALAAKPNLDLQRRLEGVQQRLKSAPTTPAMLRLVRAVDVLEHTDTPEARETLRALADRKPAIRITEAAREALERLGAQKKE